MVIPFHTLSSILPSHHLPHLILPVLLFPVSHPTSYTLSPPLKVHPHGSLLVFWLLLVFYFKHTQFMLQPTREYHHPGCRKGFWQSLTFFFTKVLENLGIQGTHHHNLVRVPNKKSIAYIMWKGEKLKDFPLKSETTLHACSVQCSNLSQAIREERRQTGYK